MKYMFLVFVQVSIGIVILQKKGMITKPIHLVAFIFFTLLMAYAITSLLPILSEFMATLTKYINHDAIQF